MKMKSYLRKQTIMLETTGLMEKETTTRLMTNIHLQEDYVPCLPHLKLKGEMAQLSSCHKDMYQTLVTI